MSDTTVPTQMPNSQQSVPPQPVKPVQPPAAPPNISGHKEHAPAAPMSETPVQEVAKPPELSPELKELGVEHGIDAKEQKLAEEVKKAGVQLTKEATPFSQPALAAPTNIAMSYDEAVLAAKKERSTKNARSWWLREAIREWKKRFLLGKESSKE